MGTALRHCSGRWAAHAGWRADRAGRVRRDCLHRGNDHRLSAAHKAGSAHGGGDVRRLCNDGLLCAGADRPRPARRARAADRGSGAAGDHGMPLLPGGAARPAVLRDDRLHRCLCPRHAGRPAPASGRLRSGCAGRGVHRLLLFAAHFTPLGSSPPATRPRGSGGGSAGAVHNRGRLRGLVARPGGTPGVREALLGADQLHRRAAGSHIARRLAEAIAAHRGHSGRARRSVGADAADYRAMASGPGHRAADLLRGNDHRAPLRAGRRLHHPAGNPAGRSQHPGPDKRHSPDRRPLRRYGAGRDTGRGGRRLPA